MFYYISMMATNVHFLFTGHVDHGKSTLAGHMLYKCNYIDDREFDKLCKKAEENKMPTWRYAYVMDIFDEERANGKTLDFNTARFKYKDRDYTMIDTPGHKSLIRSLISGLNNTNCGLVGCLVVSAIGNEFEAGMGNGQTKEDLILMRAVGIENIIVAVNKMDIFNYDNAIFTSRCSVLNAFIVKLGFKTVEYIMVSGYQGYNIYELLDKITSIYDTITPLASIVSVDEECALITAQIKIIALDSDSQLIAPGFECVAHIKNNEYQVVIDDLRLFDTKLNKVTSKKFAKVGEVMYAKIKRLESSMMVSAGDRIILRRGEATIGFGKLLFL